MEELDIQMKEKISKLIEYLLELVEGKVQRFEVSYEMRCSCKYGNDPWKEWTEVIYPVVVVTKFGEEWLSMNFTHLENKEDTVEIAVHEFIYTKDFAEQDRNNILERLYSPEYSELKNS